LETAFDDDKPKIIELQIIELNSKTLSVAKTATRATQAAVVTTTVLQIIFVGSLAQIWGMINGVQMIIHCPLFTVEIP